ncbi:MAG: hypothetical protein IKO28_07000 [Prevotella sp.]|nr:hypothetical protein [Prevotella sp.]MBR4650525.1 hypothetical protein [Prevotella sp.]
MTKEELQSLVEKYHNKSNRIYPSDEEKASLYERIASQLEDDMDYYINNESYSTEEEVVEDIIETLNEVDNFYSEEDYENMDMLD